MRNNSGYTLEYRFLEFYRIFQTKKEPIRVRCSALWQVSDAIRNFPPNACQQIVRGVLSSAAPLASACSLIIFWPADVTPGCDGNIQAVGYSLLPTGRPTYQLVSIINVTIYRYPLLKPCCVCYYIYVSDNKSHRTWGHLVEKRKMPPSHWKFAGNYLTLWQHLKALESP